MPKVFLLLALAIAVPATVPATAGPYCHEHLAARAASAAGAKRCEMPAPIQTDQDEAHMNRRRSNSAIGLGFLLAGGSAAVSGEEPHRLLQPKRRRNARDIPNTRCSTSQLGTALRRYLMLSRVRASNMSARHNATDILNSFLSNGCPSSPLCPRMSGMSRRIKFHLHTIECPHGLTAPHAVMRAQLNWLPLKDSLTGSNSSARMR